MFKKYPDFTIKEALDGASYDSTAIWEPWTVQTIQSVLLISWLSVFGFISLLCSSFLLLQEKGSRVMRCRFIFSGNNDELTLDFLDTGFPLGVTTAFRLASDGACTGF